MSPADLLDKFEAYYGPWPTDPARPGAAGVVPSEILNYIAEEINSARLDRLYKAVLRSHSTRNGAPDVAAIELAVHRAEESGIFLKRVVRGGRFSSGEPVSAEERRLPTKEDLAQVEEAKRRLEGTDLGRRLLADVKLQAVMRRPDLLDNWEEGGEDGERDA